MSSSQSFSQQSANANTFQFPLVGPQRTIARDVAVPLAQGGLGAFGGAAEFQGFQSPIGQDVLAQLRAQFGEEFGERGTRGALSADLLAQQNALAAGEAGRLTSFGQATPDELELIRANQEAQFAAGSGLIQRGARTGLTALREELGPSLGLRSTDTPIQDRGQVVAREALFQEGQLANRLAQQAAGLALEVPLRRDIAGSAAAQGQQGILGQRQALGAELQTRSLQNRLALAGQVGQQGLGLASLVNVPGLLQGVRPSQGGQSESDAFSLSNAASFSLLGGGGGGR